MGTAVTGQRSNECTADQASSMFSPVHRRGTTGGAPSTPSAVGFTKAPKRLQNMAEDDENGMLTTVSQLCRRKSAPKGASDVTA